MKQHTETECICIIPQKSCILMVKVSAILQKPRQETTQTPTEQHYETTATTLQPEIQEGSNVRFGRPSDINDQTRLQGRLQYSSDAEAGPSSRPESERPESSHQRSTHSDCQQIDGTSDSEQSEAGSIRRLHVDLRSNLETTHDNDIPTLKTNKKNYFLIPHRCDILKFLQVNYTDHVGQN